MKINRKKPLHWVYLLLFFAQSLLALVLRALRRPGSTHTVVLYGHKLNGNLLALHGEMVAAGRKSLVPVFLTMDLDYKRELESSGVRCAWACGFSGMRLLALASSVISDHGLHSMQPLLRMFQRAGLLFFDVWHGIPFKGFDADDFKLQRRYTETWVASELIRALYISNFGFKPDRVVVTGYPRTDRLIHRRRDAAQYRKIFKLPERGKLILFAPTWKQDAVGRSIYPFGCSEQEFMEALVKVAKKHKASVVLRNHVNCAELDGTDHAEIHILPASRYPDTEALLLACDVLVCDWSSIVFDYLLLDRPAFFLEVKPPFSKGFSLGPEYRYGAIVNGLQSLIHGVDQALTNPNAYWRDHAIRHRAIKDKIYGDVVDGHAAKRCIERLRTHVGFSEPMT